MAPPPPQNQPAPKAAEKKESAREEGVKVAKRVAIPSADGPPDDESFVLGGSSGASEAPAPRWPTVPSSLRAKLRHHTAGGLMVFEILVQDALVWSPGLHVMVRMADGREIAAPVATSTTAAGTYAVGHVVRLVVNVGVGEEHAQPIAVLVAGRFIPVVVE